MSSDMSNGSMLHWTGACTLERHCGCLDLNQGGHVAAHGDTHQAGGCPGCTPTQELLDELEARGVLRSWSKRSLCSAEELVSYASAEPISRVVTPPAGPVPGGGEVQP